MTHQRLRIELRPAIASTCLFLSGAAALVYEVCWIRQSALVFGSSTLATSTLLAVFFGGLALGSYLAARMGVRIRSPVRLYAGLEIGIGILGVASLALFDLADPIYGSIHRAFRSNPAMLAALRALVVGSVILPPAVLMGASLPLLCSQVPDEPRRIAASVGILYGANTLGAAVGCLAAGLVLIPALGVTAAIVGGALANGAAAALAFRLGDAPAAGRSATVRASRPQDATLPLGVLFFLAGFTGLAYEVLWTRFLGLVLRNTVYTYTLSLAVVLLGIVIGSLLGPRLSRDARASGRAFGALQAVSGIYVVALLLLPPGAWQQVDGGVLTCLSLFLPAAICSGASFPLAVHAVAEGGGPLGGHVGRMAAINTLGGIMGSLAAGFVGLPLLGLQTSVLLTTGVSVGVGIGAWMLHSTRRSRLGDLAVAGMMLTAWLVVPRFLGTRLPADFLAGGGVLVDFREGRTADAAVVRTNGLLQLQIDRWWQGEERKTHQAVSAHLVMQLHPNPRSVLVVGAGTGQTARRFLEYPIDRLDVVDIEPVVFDLIAKHFDDGWMSDPRVALIRDDGRNLVAHTDRSYDVIALEVGQIFRPGVASFYTTDFYSRARARLRDGGRLAQFVPLAFLTPEELRSIVASFIAVFPESVLWYNSGELLLIGAHGDRIGASDDRLALLVEDDTIHADLRYSYWGDRSDWMNQPDVLLAGFLSGAAGLAGLSADAETYRDDRPVLEYEASRAGRSRTAEIAIAPLLREHLDPLQSIFDAPLAPERSARIVAQREQNLADLIASAHVRRAEELGATGDIEGGLTEVAKALRQNPSSVPALRVAGNLLVAAGRIEEARGRYLDVLRLEPADPLSLRGLGRCSLAAGQVDEAIDYYESALAVRPNDAETRNNLGALRASRRELRDALIHFREAVRLNPHDRGAQENLQRLETLLGSTQDGRELLQTRAATPAGTISAGPGPPPDPR